MNNLHICINEFRNASRILKQVTTASKISNIDLIFIAALHSKKNKTKEKISNKIFLNRFRLKTRFFKKNLFLQLIKYIEYSIRIIIFYRKKNIKIINIHSLSLLPLGFLLKFLYDAKLIYDTHELETETNGLKGLRKISSKLVESLFINKVDHIFVVSENIADWYHENYKILRPTVLFNSPHIKHLKKNNYLRKKFFLKKKQKIVLYQGSLQPGRGIEKIIHAFKKRTNNNVVIIFMGYGSLEKKILSVTKVYKNIFFHKAVSPSVLLKYTSSADIGIALIENTCLSYNFCMPNKLFEYVMAGLPVMVSNVKEMSDFVNKNKIGVVLKNDSAFLINDTMDKLLSSNLTTFKKNCKKIAFSYSWKNQEKKMMHAYEKLLIRNKY